MARVTVELPSLLRAVAANAPLAVEARSLRDALAALVADHPGLRVHLFDEAGDLRQHVLCFHNGTNTRWMPSLDIPVAEGDVVTIMQAVSGG